MSFNLNQYRGVVETFNTQKWIFQQGRKKCSLINYVNINSVLDYPLSIFILLVFLFLGLKHISHKTSIKLFVLFLFVISFCQTLFLVAKPVGEVEVNSGLTRTAQERLSICHFNLNCISAHNHVKLTLLKA